MTWLLIQGNKWNVVDNLLTMYRIVSES